MRARWSEAWGAVGPTPPNGLFEALLERYSEAHRAYHTWEHVRACLDVVGPELHTASRPHEVVLALFFHDAIYEPTRPDNEQRSADWAQQALSDAGATDAGDRVAALVLATAHGGAHPAAAAGPDADLVVDSDLSILGESAPVYDTFEQAIRMEFSAVEPAAFRAGRGQVLRGFLDRDAIYRLPAFVARYEQAARVNLARALAHLDGGPS